MRCPKCHYISFDSNDRCRNCGYEFSLSSDGPIEPIDLPIQTGDEALGPLSDFALIDANEIDARVPEPPAPRLAVEREPPPSATRRTPAPQPPPSSMDLPLFKDRRIDDDTPLVSPTAVPRAPLSVRRSSPVPPRSGARSPLEEPALDLDAPEEIDESDDVEEPAPAITPRRTLAPLPRDPGSLNVSSPAAAIPRVFAAAIDALILGSVAAVVLYFTLQVCRLELAEVDMLPPAPFAAFLCLLAGGYFILFTVAGGQTIGKMAAGIKVVLVEEEGRWSDRVPLGRAVLRAVGYVVSVLPAGLGFLPALFAADRRAVHDRLADTRVVKA